MEKTCTALNRTHKKVYKIFLCFFLFRFFVYFHFADESKHWKLLKKIVKMSENREDQMDSCSVSVELIFSHQIMSLIVIKSSRLERNFDLENIRLENRFIFREFPRLGCYPGQKVSHYQSVRQPEDLWLDLGDKQQFQQLPIHHQIKSSSSSHFFHRFSWFLELRNDGQIRWC